MLMGPHTMHAKTPGHSRFVRRLLPTLLFAAWMGFAGAAEEEITLNFVNADIESVVKAVAQITGKNFVLDPRVKGNINIVSAKPVNRTLAYQVLVSALRLQGFSVVEGGNVTKILPEADAKIQAGPVTGSGQGDQIVTQVFHVRYESAVQLVAALKPLVSANQSVTANAASNTLVITDSADNLRRLERIIASIDVPQGDDPQIIPLKYASAVDVAASINRLYASGNSAGATAGAGAISVIADPRSNRIVMRSENAGLLVRARALVTELDKPDSGLGNIRVVYLRHAEAARVAQMLRAILGSDSGVGTGSGNSQSGSFAAPMQTSTSNTSTTSNTQGNSNTSLGGNTVPSFSNNGNQNQQALVAGSMIQADTASNALIITAPEPIFNNLRNVIDMLDRRRAQVYIEALVVELTAERAAEFGIQWQDLSGLSSNSTRVFGGTNFGSSGQNIIGVAQNVGSVGGGLNIGVSKGQITIPGLGTVTNLGFLAHFLESEVKANILSTPNILTLDNEEAKIVIGQNLPFVTGSYSTTGSGSTTVTPFQTYERKDVGLTLKVKPQITEGGVVKVQIYQEASSVQAGTTTNTAGPTTNKRSLESNVLVDDGSVIVLGGLIEDSLGYNDERVPVLGEVPVLGNLFRYETRSRKKTNLMVFLRPHIIRDSNDYRGLTDDRYDMLLGAQKRQGEETRSWKGDQGSVPLLPELGKRSQP